MIFLQTNLVPIAIKASYSNAIESETNSSQGKYALIPSEERLEQFAITREQFKRIIDFVENMGPLSARKIIKRNIVNNLPFSIACTPSVDTVATYILFNKHFIQEIGKGKDNLVTFGWDVTAQNEVAVRTAKKDSISDKEREIITKLSVHQNLFIASSEIFDYEGPHNIRKLFLHDYVPTKECVLAPMPKDNAEHLVNNKPDKKLVPKTAIILEAGGCLNSFFKTDLLTPERIISIARDVLQGLVVLHGYKIVHMDIKPDNIILTNGLKAKITDFGNSRYDGEAVWNKHRPVDAILTSEPKAKNADFGHSKCEDDEIRDKNTFFYVPPEILKKIPYNAIHDYKADFPSDLWSFGVSLVILIGKSMNIEVWKEWRNVVQEMLKLHSNKPELVSKFLSDFKEKIENVENQEKDEILKIFPLLEKCLQVFPQDRITAEEGVEIIEGLISNASITL